MTGNRVFQRWVQVGPNVQCLVRPREVRWLALEIDHDDTGQHKQEFLVTHVSRGGGSLTASAVGVIAQLLHANFTGSSILGPLPVTAGIAILSCKAKNQLANVRIGWKADA